MHPLPFVSEIPIESAASPQPRCHLATQCETDLYEQVAGVASVEDWLHRGLHQPVHAVPGIVVTPGFQRRVRWHHDVRELGRFIRETGQADNVWHFSQCAGKVGSRGKAEHRVDVPEKGHVELARSHLVCQRQHVAKRC